MEERVSEFISRLQEGHKESSDYPVNPLQAFISSIILGSDFEDKKSTKELCELLLDKYRDVWYHALGLLRNILIVSVTPRDNIPSRDTHLLRILRVMEENKIASDVAIGRIFAILEKVKRPTSQLTELEVCLESFGDKKMSMYRVQFKNAWSEFLRCCSASMNRAMLVKLLRNIPDSVLPHIQNGEIFASFFSECFNRTDDVEVALLSVSGLFHIISRHNLGEPDDLYSKLYQLISPKSMRKSTQSNRVFQLLVKVLRSPLMPSRLVPVFAKKLLRVAVVVGSPSMTLWLVVAAFNLMQAHPIVSRSLLHREDIEGMGTSDPFDLECKDIDSMAQVLDRTSLWELELLLQHTDPSVVRMASMFKTNFFSKKAKRISSDDYLLITDEQLLNRERKYGSHSKASKKLKADVELERIAGEDFSRDDVVIPIAVVTPNDLQALKLSDERFLSSLQTAYSK
jgi:hypothetical protein